ncbi:PREDICTED: UDP-GalNAc:beta-1,3-N-acetylgalactosaminyltransferase 1-like [Papilio polytes]|uniref:UDP-GalNAc:beta-1, 3-N-acetylgalactosaminyltransferase 1-like n=1 Tax=Papilio polytes TaxID=76194 RepID=UPI0006769406|nr:PREDICTED: UDP-GalNAc:beta-1,3-N-acetylgalactosaminyltransferase 1-like [Papilio polytes]
MRKKQTFVIALILLSVIIWVYKSSNKEYDNIMNVIAGNNHYIRKIIIKPNETCNLNRLFIILVTSYVGHVELRSAHRRAMSAERLKSMNATRIFLLAKIPRKEKYITQNAVYDESEIFGDILQGGFTEDYRNLTYKHLMGLQWASNFCNTSFILKVDDDIVFNLNQTYNFMLKIRHEKNLLIGYMLNNTLPRRSKQNKWYVTQKEYSRNVYPSYLSGWYYIMSKNIAFLITQEAPYHGQFWIDDIFVTGILTEFLDIKLKHLPKDYWLEYYELLECCLKDMVMKSIQCEYVVAPNGGRNELIVEFNDALEKCKRKNCTVRSDNQTLNKVCINYRERTIFGDGKAVIQNIKL